MATTDKLASAKQIAKELGLVPIVLDTARILLAVVIKHFETNDTLTKREFALMAARVLIGRNGGDDAPRI